MQYVSVAILLKRIRAIKSFLLDSSVPKRKKILVIFGIIYLLMPFDLIPAPVLGLSIIDDAILWLFILIHLSEELDSYWKDREKADADDSDIILEGREIFQSTGKTIEDDEVEREIYDSAVSEED